jgi:hypothetical protein
LAIWSRKSSSHSIRWEWKEYCATDPEELSRLYNCSLSFFRVALSTKGSKPASTLKHQQSPQGRAWRKLQGRFWL